MPGVRAAGGAEPDARDELRHNRPRWLARLALGSLALAAALPAVLATPAGFGILNEVGGRLGRRAGFFGPLAVPGPFAAPGTTAAALTRSAGPADWSLLALAAALALAAPALLIVGTWLVTGPPRPGRSVGRLGWACRALSFAAPIAATAALLNAPVLRGLDLTHPLLASGIVLLAGLGLTAVLALLLTRHLRGLARRAPAPLLAADSPIVGYTLGGLGLAVVLVIGLGVADAIPEPPRPWRRVGGLHGRAGDGPRGRPDGRALERVPARPVRAGVQPDASGRRPRSSGRRTWPAMWAVARLGDRGGGG